MKEASKKIALNLKINKLKKKRDRVRCEITRALVMDLWSETTKELISFRKLYLLSLEMKQYDKQISDMEKKIICL